jgi:hypothetical protein
VNGHRFGTLTGRPLEGIECMNNGTSDGPLLDGGAPDEEPDHDDGVGRRPRPDQGQPHAVDPTGRRRL